MRPDILPADILCAVITVIAVAYGAMLIAAGIGLAAILAGEGEAGALILGGSQQFGVIEALAYSRVNESAADQYAAKYMETTGQSAQGLIDFFERFRVQEVLSQARRYPYFRGHPLSGDRIDALREKVEDSPYTGKLDSEEDQHRLDMAKAKLRGFLEGPQLVFSRFPPDDKSKACPLCPRRCLLPRGRLKKCP